MAPDSALLFVILSPVSAYYKTGADGAVSIYADPNVVRAFPGGVGNRKVGSNYGPTISKINFNTSDMQNTSDDSKCSHRRFYSRGATST